MIKRAYVAGKVTGLPIEKVKTKFQNKVNELLAAGYDVVNPVAKVAFYNQYERPDRPLNGWNEEMRFCIKQLMDCDELHLLPCWKDSAGAQLERYIALRLGMPVIYH